VLVDNLGNWFGGVQWRNLGPYPINKGPGYCEVNVDGGYKINSHLKVQLVIYNPFNTQADSPAYYYTSRLPGKQPGRIARTQLRPLSPSRAS
jgi:hypothetical protein